jgi:hypothetical protein
MAAPVFLVLGGYGGFHVAGSNWFTDYLATPLMRLAQRIAPRASVRLMARLLAWSLRTFSKPPWGVAAIPVVACLLQYLDGTARRPGLWMMGHLADPARLVADMRRMGVIVC